MGKLISERAQRLISGMLVEWNRSFKGRQPPAKLGPAPTASSFAPGTYVLRTPAAGIPAMTEAAGEFFPGEAQCTVYYITVDKKLAQWLDSSGNTVTVPVLNIASSDVAGDVFIQCKQEMIGGGLLADFEDCLQ